MSHFPKKVDGDQRKTETQTRVLYAQAPEDEKPPVCEKQRPDDFVNIADVEPTILRDIRYYSLHNFIGDRVRGYGAPVCLLTRKAAEAVKGVQADLLKQGLSLKIYDCFRPQQAVGHFVEWAKNISDTRMKAEFYPDVDKRNLFSDGYIAFRSSHTRGSTVDLAIVKLPAPKQETYKPAKPLRSCQLPVGVRFGDDSIDFGSGFDCFGPISATENPSMGPEQHTNRMLLKGLMDKHGFKNYDMEWWHYTLRDEPYPDQCFDFEVK